MQPIRVYWNRNGLHWTIRRHVHGQDELIYPFRVGNSITVKVTGHRHCIGFFDPESGTQQSCLNQRIAESGQCGECRKIDNAEREGRSMTSRERLEHEPHVVYLALFGNTNLPESPSVIKVGVTLRERRGIRLLEQGAHAALFIAEGDGYTVRRIEQMIHALFDITERVHPITKVKLLLTWAIPQEARSLLTTRAHSLTWEGSRDDLLDTFRFSYLRTKYPLTIPERHFNILRPRKMIRGDIISGEIMGYIGKHVVLKTLHGPYMSLPVTQLSGYRVVAKSTLATTECSLGYHLTNVVSYGRIARLKSLQYDLLLN